MFPRFFRRLVQNGTDFFQLGHVHRIGVPGPSGHTGDLPGQFRSAAYGHGGACCHPGGGSICGGLFSGRIIAGFSRFHRSQRPAPQGHAPFHCRIGIVAQDHHILLVRSSHLVRRTNHNAVGGGRKGPIVPQQQSRSRIFHRIAGPDHGHMLDIGGGIFVSGNHIVLTDGSAGPGHLVPHPDNGCFLGVIRLVPAPDGQGGPAAVGGGNGRPKFVRKGFGGISAVRGNIAQTCH